MMLREDFENQYAERSGVTTDWIKKMGQVSLPCDCDEDGCNGWKMISLRNISPYDLQFIPEPYKTEIKTELSL